MIHVDEWCRISATDSTMKKVLPPLCIKRNVKHTLQCQYTNNTCDGCVANQHTFQRSYRVQCAVACVMCSGFTRKTWNATTPLSGDGELPPHVSEVKGPLWTPVINLFVNNMIIPVTRDNANLQNTMLVSCTVCGSLCSVLGVHKYNMACCLLGYRQTPTSL